MVFMKDLCVQVLISISVPFREEEVCGKTQGGHEGLCGEAPQLGGI